MPNGHDMDLELGFFGREYLSVIIFLSFVDDIDVKLIKYYHKHLIHPLAHLINLIFMQGNVPKHLESINLEVRLFAKIFKNC